MADVSTFPGPGGKPWEALRASPFGDARGGARPGVVWLEVGESPKRALESWTAVGVEALLPRPNWRGDREALAVIDAAAGHLAGLDTVDADRLVVAGQGEAGGLAFLAGCTSRRCSGVVAVEPVLVREELNEAHPFQPLELLLNLDVPLLAFFSGRNQKADRPEEIQRLREALEAGCKRFEIVVYDESPAGLFDPEAPESRQAAVSSAWERIQRFLAEDL